MPLSELFLVEVSETAQRVFNTEWDLLAPTTASLMRLIPGKAKTRGSRNDVWKIEHLSFGMWHVSINRVVYPVSLGKTLDIL